MYNLPIVSLHFLFNSKYRNTKVEPLNGVLLITVILCILALIIFLLRLGWTNVISPWIASTIKPTLDNSKVVENIFYILKLVGGFIILLFACVAFWEFSKGLISYIKILFGNDQDARMEKIVYPILGWTALGLFIGIGTWLYLHGWMCPSFSSWHISDWYLLFLRGKGNEKNSATKILICS